jgi:hypothetical protein
MKRVKSAGSRERRSMQRMNDVTVRAATPTDSAGWRRLWRCYLDFYRAQ